MKSDLKEYTSHDSEWQLQEAKNCLSQAVNLAIQYEAQIINLHGNTTTIVVSFEEYQKLIKPKSSLSQFSGQSPLYAFGLGLA